MSGSANGGFGIAKRGAAGSLDSLLAAAKGRPSGFDYLRILLSLSVIVVHTFPLSYGIDYNLSGAGLALQHFILPMFFALSGFLVAGSLERSPSIVVFLGLRVIRLEPALLVEVCLSALILGPVFTTLPLHAYFLDPGHEFFRYFLNVLGLIHYQLPGVFASNPYPNVVNEQLWTIPWELRCYLTLTVLSLLGIAKRRRAMLAFTLIGTVAITVWALFQLQAHGPAEQVKFGTFSLWVAFLAGVSLYNFREIVPWSGWLCAACAGLAFVLLRYVTLGNCFAGLLLAYVTVFLGLANPKRLAILRGADYSYGIYLYGFAIQQAVTALLPSWREWYINLAISIPIAALFAAFSWIVIEKPSQRLKKYLPMAKARPENPVRKTAGAESFTA